VLGVIRDGLEICNKNVMSPPCLITPNTVFVIKKKSKDTVQNDILQDN